MKHHSHQKSIEEVDVSGKNVLIRVDFNVPINQEMKIRDSGRIRAALPTIRYVLDHGGKAILMSHLGRPKGKRVNRLSLYPVVAELSQLLDQEVYFAPDSVGEETVKMVKSMANGEVILLENLRFHAEEEQNDDDFADSLAQLGDIYINDAFGAAHRAHASTVGITNHVEESAIGYLMNLELEFLGNLLLDPAKPFAAILGGAKVSDKIKVIENLLHHVQMLFIGGGMACTFLKAMGYEIGDSLLEEGSIEVSQEILKVTKEKEIPLLLPTDCVIAEKLQPNASTRIIRPEDGVPPGWKILDIGPDTIRRFKERLVEAKTIFWNGPMGVFEIKAFAAGTFGIAQTMVECSAKGTVTVIGGGDSAAAVQQMGIAKEMTHISTGGGASLEYLEGKALPGVEAITTKKR